MSIDSRNNWLHFVSRSSESGANWITAFREKVRDHPDLGFRAVGCFQQHQFSKGLQFLENYKNLIKQQESERDVMDHVLLRWYYAAEAYYYYCTESYDKALISLELAQQSIARAIEERPFLVVLAASCEEFCLHKARVARNCRRWKEMEEHIEVARKMVAGQGPLCRLPCGREITFHDVKQFYFSVQDMTDEERQSLLYVEHDGYRLSKFEQFVGNMYVLPGFVVVY